MKLRTSCFKGITLKKDILRFAPVWALYLIGMMMLLVEMGNYQDYDRYARNFLPGFVTAFGIVNLCYATLIAAALFGDLYNTKLCYSLHAMPYRRESWLVTHLLAGLLFSLVPNGIACVFLMIRLKAYWFLGLYWLLAVTLQFLFFYGIATVSAMLTGNRFAMLLVCAGFNFIAMLLYATVNVIYIPMLTGVVTNLESFSRFSPVVQLFRYDYFEFSRKECISVDINKPAYGESDYFYQYEGLSTGWGYLAILGVVGVVAIAFGFWLYRKRHLESAGDFIAFPRLKGIACVIMTLCVTLCFALLGELFGSMILWLIVGLIIGYFGSLMLLERRLKVFRKKTFLGFIAMGIAVAISLVSIYFDWFGIEEWTPKADKVASVTVSNSRNIYSSTLTATLEDEEDISQIITAHEDILSRIHYSSNNTYRVTLTYKMKSGRTVVRSYRAPSNGQGYEIIRQYLYNTATVLGFTDATAAAKNMTYMYSSLGKVPPAMYEQVLKALQRNCANGHVSIGGDKYAEYYIEYIFTDSAGKEVQRYLCVDQGAEKVLALLKTPEFIMGYADWDAFLSSVQSVGLSSQGHADQVITDQKSDLLAALRKDIEAGVADVTNYSHNAYTVYYDYYTADGTTDYREFYITEKAENTYTWIKENAISP